MLEKALKDQDLRDDAMMELMNNHAVSSSTDPDQIENMIDEVIKEKVARAWLKDKTM